MSAAKYQLNVTVQSRYLPEQSDPQNRQYAFSYAIRITNTGSVATQVVSRHWIISDSDGRQVEVKGLGVVGHQPLLAPGESFEYTSGAQIETPVGSMRGSYFCVAEDGERFEAGIPEFALTMPNALH